MVILFPSMLSTVPFKFARSPSATSTTSPVTKLCLLEETNDLDVVCGKLKFCYLVWGSTLRPGSVKKENGKDRTLVMWRAPVQPQGARLDINLFIFKEFGTLPSESEGCKRFIFWRKQRLPRLSLFRSPSSPSLWKLSVLKVPVPYVCD